MEGFKITIENDNTEFKYLDARLNLFNSTYKPYHKESENLKYINFSSNYPHSIKKALIEKVSRRISNLASDKDSFDQRIYYYNRALEKAEYTRKFEFKPKLKNEGKTIIENQQKQKQVIK